ncbi:hypothetical protein [Streptomyces sp. YIM 98790]|uniref:hypothetical protein n=1 Tax=Streptomyces sp. YIM 98790 TaxID=2689077 RepID=UPI0014089F9F|nr:hypothetical protein [Streptomyces sp. YIM 98790]
MKLLVKTFLVLALVGIWAGLLRFSFWKSRDLRRLQREGVRGAATCIGHSYPRSGVCAVLEYYDGAGNRHVLTGPVRPGPTPAIGEKTEIVFDPRTPRIAALWPVTPRMVRNRLAGGVASSLLFAACLYAALQF